MSIKFASLEHITQRDNASPLIARNEGSDGIEQQTDSPVREGRSNLRNIVGKMSFAEALVRALDATFILMVTQDERHYIGERRQAFVPQDDPELIDHVTDVILSEGATIRRAVESVFLEASQSSIRPTAGD